MTIDQLAEALASEKNKSGNGQAQVLDKNGQPVNGVTVSQDGQSATLN